MKRIACFLPGLLLFQFGLNAQMAAGSQWPHPIPCRIGDGSNPDVFVMTLGDVKTPLAQGVFDPVADTVKLNDGTTRTNYYRDMLGVKFYAPLDKSRFPLPPSGFCTWYYYYNRINEDEVKRNADWIAENLKDYGANYVQIDDGWQGTGGRDGTRNWEAVNPRNFPDGMAALAKYIKSRGLEPGIWLAPHGQSDATVVSNHPDVFLLKPDGTSASETWEGRFLVDPTAPESMDYLKALFTKLAGWGYDYFKIDGQPIVVREYDTKKQFMRNPTPEDGAALYRKTIETIRGAIGPDRYLLGCWGIPLEGAGIMNGSRTGGDIVLGWGGFQVALRPTLEYMYLHNIVWYCDPDVMCVRSPLTLDQARAWATLEGLTGQALMTSDRLPDLSDDRVELLRRVYPATDIRPLDLFPTQRYKRIWDLKIAHLGRQYDVVGVFNFNTEKADKILLKWKDLGIADDQPVHVFDFWNKEYLGAWSKGMVVETAPTSCRVLTLVPATDQVQFISSSRHITQGWVDLVALNSKTETRNSKPETIFNGTSKVVRQDPYTLSFAFPRATNYVVTRAVASTGAFGKLPVKIFNHQGWASVGFTSPKTTEVKWEIEFAPAAMYHFPPSPPEGVFARRAGLDGVNLGWREQYYLNAGYQVYLNGEPQGYTPSASFPLRGLNAQSNYTAEVKAIWTDGEESRRGGQVKFNLADLVPAEVSLTQIEPERSTGRWRGFELEEMLSAAPLKLGGKSYDTGLSSFANGEIEFNLNGLFEKFSSTIGVDANSSESARVEFTVAADGREIWHSGPMQNSDAPKPIELDVAGVHKLTLRSAGSGGGRRTRAHADWIEPTVTRSKRQ